MGPEKQRPINLRQRLRYPLRENLDRIAAAAAATGGYALSIEGMEMSRVQVDEDALRLWLDIGLNVR